MNARNDLFVAAVTFLGTIVLVVTALVFYGYVATPPPVVGPTTQLADTSQAVRSKPRGNAAHSVELAAARSRIAELEQAMDEKDSRYLAAQKRARQELKDYESERGRLLETVNLLEQVMSVTDPANSRNGETGAGETGAGAVETGGSETGGDSPVDATVADVLGKTPGDETESDTNSNSTMLEQARDDYRALEERLGRYIQQLNESNQRVSTAARLAVVQVGEAAVGGLIPLLESEDPAVQLWALRTLQQMGPAASGAAQAVTTLRSHPLPEIAQAAADAYRTILE